MTRVDKRSPLRSRRARCLVSAIALGLCACGGDATSANGSTARIDPASVSLDVGADLELRLVGRPLSTAGAAEPVTWASDNSVVASVERDPGDPTHVRVHAEAPGQTFVTASGSGWNASATVIVKGVTSILLSKSSLSMSVGDKATLAATVSSVASSPSSWPVRWGSSSPLVASVDAAGNVTALRVGKSQVRASAGQVTASSTVTVTGTAPTVKLSSPDSLVGTVQQDVLGYALLCKFPPFSVSSAGEGTLTWWNFDDSINAAPVSSHPNFAAYWGLDYRLNDGETKTAAVPVWTTSRVASPSDASRFTYTIRAHYSLNAAEIDYVQGIADDYTVQHTWICLPP